jgi:hypothetical protein
MKPNKEKTMDKHKNPPSGKQNNRMGVHRGRNFFFVFLGIMGLLLVFWYDSEPYYEFIHSYGGNFTASFAFYFIFQNALSRYRANRITNALATLLVAEIFEATDGFFGMMVNTYDPMDYVANALGVALAFGLDILVARLFNRKGKATS